MYKKYRHLIFGYWGEGNFGDDLLLNAIIKMKVYDINETIIISSNPVKIYNEYGVRAINKKSIFEIFKSLFVSEVFIVGYGGLLNKKNTSTYLLLLMIGIFYSVFRSKQIRIERIGLEKGSLFRLIHRYVFYFYIKKANKISVRDKSSYSEVLRYFPKANIDIENDLAIEYLKSLGLEYVQKKKSIGLALMNVKDFDYSVIKDYVLSIKDQGYTVNVYIAFKQEGDYVLSKSVFSDISVKYIFYNQGGEKNIKEFIESVASEEIFVSMRYHAMIISFLSGAKTVAIPHNSKIRSFAEDNNLIVFD